jgi:hypothetical protein
VRGQFLRTCYICRLDQMRSKGPHAAFVPTGMAKLLEGVCQAFPRHNLIIADFDSLPPPTVDSKDEAKGTRDTHSACLVDRFSETRYGATGVNISHHQV